MWKSHHVSSFVKRQEIIDWCNPYQSKPLWQAWNGQQCRDRAETEQQKKKRLQWLSREMFIYLHTVSGSHCYQTSITTTGSRGKKNSLLEENVGLFLIIEISMWSLTVGTLLNIYRGSYWGRGRKFNCLFCRQTVNAFLVFVFETFSKKRDP